MPNFKIYLIDQEYTVESSSRAKAVTEAISQFKEAFPKSCIPSSILRNLAKTSTIEPMDDLSRDEVEKIFGGTK